MASELPPAKWDIEVLQSLRSAPISIFGYQHVAMDRTKSISLIEALVWTGLSPSNGQARQSIRGGAVRLNSQRNMVEAYQLDKDDALPNLDAIVIENGRFNFGIIELC